MEERLETFLVVALFLPLRIWGSRCNPRRKLLPLPLLTSSSLLLPLSLSRSLMLCNSEARFWESITTLGRLRWFADLPYMVRSARTFPSLLLILERRIDALAPTFILARLCTMLDRLLCRRSLTLSWVFFRRSGMAPKSSSEDSSPSEEEWLCHIASVFYLVLLPVIF